MNHCELRERLPALARKEAAADTPDTEEEEEEEKDERRRNDLKTCHNSTKSAPTTSSSFSLYLSYSHWLFLFLLYLPSLLGVAIWLDARRPPVAPSGQYERFSEERARAFLEQLVALGPRPSGSHACERGAVELLSSKITALIHEVDRLGVNRLELDIQRPSGCFEMGSLANRSMEFTFCHHRVTNVVARLSSRNSSTKNLSPALLLNAHFDTIPDAPGATDDAAAVATAMEVLELMAHSQQPLPYDLIFLFNGAEENFLQGAQGFITKHPWRHSIRAFLNLEGAGAGGRELLFRVGPSAGANWLLRTYLEHAPHPFANVVGQDLYEAGAVPSITDFQIFGAFGGLSGLDLAYVRNGWNYHTEFDEVRYIEVGALQHAGDNLLAVTKAALASGNLGKPLARLAGSELADREWSSKWVFFDVFGLFSVCYSLGAATLLNFTAISAVAAILLVKIHFTKAYSPQILLLHVGQHLLAVVAMLLTGVLTVYLVTISGYTMIWHARPWVLLPLYAWPMFNAGLGLHSAAVNRWRGSCGTSIHQKWRPLSEKDHSPLRNSRSTPLKDESMRESAHYDSALLLWAIILAVLTLRGLPSAFIYLIHLVFPLLREGVLLGTYGKFTTHRAAGPTSPRGLYWAQLSCAWPSLCYLLFSAHFSVEFFAPILARSGSEMNPEYPMMGLALITVSGVVMLMSNLVWVSRRLTYLLKCSLALNLLVAAVIATTRLGWPYVYSEEHPRLHRLAVMHVKRSIYDYNDQLNRTETALWLSTMDFRGVKDLPEHSFLQASFRLDCSRVEDEFCHLPYYWPRIKLLPPEKTLWVPIPTSPTLSKPVSIELLNKAATVDGRIVVSVRIAGGTDKLSYHITPLNGYHLVQWSIDPFDAESYGHRRTYFVFITSGNETLAERNVTLVLEKNQKGEEHRQGQLSSSTTAKMESNAAEEGGSCVEFSVATHYVHGPHQYSDTLRQLRTLINDRRRRPHEALGHWRWAITMMGGGAEIVVKRF